MWYLWCTLAYSHTYLFTLDLPPEEGDVRLVGGTTEYEGNVEIFVNETWGFVCDDAWGMQDAQVVCNQLGITGDAEATLIGFFGNGVGTIHLDEVGCGGSEENLLECSHDGIGSHDCFNFEAAGVICTRKLCSQLRHLIKFTWKTF